MKFFSFFVAAYFFLAIAGCGGAGTPQLPFAGGFGGTFTTNSGQNGTVDFTIGQDGVITGTGKNDTLNQTLTVTGFETDSGLTTVQFNYGSSTIDGSGDLTVDPAGQLTGTINNSSGDSVTFILTPTP